MKKNNLLLALWAISFVQFTTALGQSGGPLGTPPGRLVDIGGHKLHLQCAGLTNGTPAVIFESGGGAYSKDWDRVRSLLPAKVRTCAYDRAGSGWSEAGPTPRTMRQEVFELHALLEAAGVTGPYVLVGHSLGGLLVRMYADRYGSNVVGMVLVDATNESAMLGSFRYGGWVRLREKASDRAVPEPLREGKASTNDNPDEDYMAEEFQQIYLSRQANPQPLGDRPLIILASGARGGPPPGTSEAFWKQLGQEKEEQARALAQLSRNSKFIRDPASGHAIHQDNPELVARAIEEVLTAATRTTKLSPE